MKNFIKKTAKGLLNNFINKKPISSLSPDNLYAYLDALYMKKDIEGPVVEIGCAWGGTTGIAYTFMNRAGIIKDYYCVDTFSGFTDEHLETDYKLGLPKSSKGIFSDNSMKIVKENLYRWGVSKRIHLIKGDISGLKQEELPESISVCLLDADLRDPIYDGLHKLYPNMAKGGIILVDDCKGGTSWVGANVGYIDFMNEKKLKPMYFMGFGVVEIPGELQTNWIFSDKPIKAPGNFYDVRFQQ